MHEPYVKKDSDGSESIFDFIRKNILGYMYFIVVFIGIIFSSFALFIRFSEPSSIVRGDLHNLESKKYSAQIEAIDKVQNNLKELDVFLTNQRQEIINTENSIAELRNLEQELDPIIDAKSELVDAIFKVQESRNADNMMKERIIGFLVGVFSSLVATAILFFLRKINFNK